MTPERVNQLAATVRTRMGTGMAPDPQYEAATAALTALTDELLRHLGAPRVPTDAVAVTGDTAALPGQPCRFCNGTGVTQ